MPKNTSALIVGPAGGLASWLAFGAIGPAAVALPVNWAADKLAGAAVSWFKRLRKTDDLSRLVKTATGTSIDLNGAEFKDLRKLLEKKETWSLLAGRMVKDLADQIAACLPARGGRSTEDSCAAAGNIARGLLEFAVFDLEPDTFQKVVLARLQQMTDQASAVDKALYRPALRSLCLGRWRDRSTQRRDGQVAAKARGAGRNCRVPHDTGQLAEHRPVAGGPAVARACSHPGSHRAQATDHRCERRRVRDLDADGLAQECQRLVILGGSGSGKTWLAKRTARRRAEDALEDLAADGTLDEVELPLYTTCAHLFSAAAAADKDIREAAVSSALSQIGDLGGSRITTALRRFFTDRNAPTVLVIDSLDEARGSDAPLRRADTLPWRIILTSRPGSWNHQLRIEERKRLLPGWRNPAVAISR